MDSQALDVPAPIIRKGPVFRRLLRMLRHHYPLVALAIVLLILSMPCELFPAFIWQYVTDDLILSPRGIGHPSGLGPLISLRGSVTGEFHLLMAALVWLLGVYLIGSLAGTVSSVLMQRVAQMFTYVLR